MSVQKERNGQFTGDLGRQLKKKVESKTDRRLTVYFDHAGSGSEKIVAHLGERSSRANALSYVDIAVVEDDSHIIAGKESRKVVLLCEIEEEGARPKKIIGDLCSLLFADGVQISGSHYHLDKTHIIIGIRHNERGKSEDKTRGIIARIQKMNNTESISNIIGVYQSTHQELMDAIERKILEVVADY